MNVKELKGKLEKCYSTQREILEWLQKHEWRGVSSEVLEEFQDLLEATGDWKKESSSPSLDGSTIVSLGHDTKGEGSSKEAKK